jgi:N-sulfoglucosamine sulfohydrolase
MSQQARSQHTPTATIDPNIVIVITHDTGRHIGPYHRGVHTPHLERVAGKGVVFEQAYATAPQCSPSRASLLTGLYPHQTGMIGLAHLGFTLNKEAYQRTLPRLLAKQGYSTHLYGLQHEAENPKDLGYHSVTTAKSQGAPKEFARWVTPQTVHFLESAPPTPFYLMIGFQETHRPFDETTTPLDHIQVPLYLPDTPLFRRDIANLNEQVQRADEAVGAIYTALERTGLAEKTVFIFTTDHGISEFGAKGTLRDPGIEISLIMAGPYGLSGGRRIGSLVSNLDVYATILDLCGIMPLPGTQGFSLLPMIEEQRGQVRDTILAELTYHVAYDPQRAIRTTTTKYIKSFEPRPIHPAVHMDASAVKDYFHDHGVFAMPRDPEMLFDLQHDPHERNNLLHDVTMKATLERLRAAVQTWMHTTNDPLAQGPVPAPANAKLKDVSDYDPE